MPPKDRPNYVDREPINVRIDRPLLVWLKDRAARHERNLGRELSIVLREAKLREEQAHAEAERADYVQNQAKIDAMLGSDGAEFGPVSKEAKPKARRGK